MLLTNIKLTNFKNYADEKLVCKAKIVTILGNNGMGKTNLLDAIYYLCLGKSYFTSTDKNLPIFGSDFFRIQANIDAEEIVVKVQPGKLKNISINGVDLEKITNHVGVFPVVVIAPSDITTLLETSENRRALLNSTISQANTTYLEHLLIYNKLLKQRNALLKSFLEGKRRDLILLESLTTQMKVFANTIFTERLKFIDLLLPIFKSTAVAINQKAEDFELKYESDYASLNHEEIFEKSLEKDLMTGRSNAGVHRDDLVLYMNDLKLKDYGSQGQIKSCILALKLAQYQVLKTICNKKPFLLLDDVFDKLDTDRMNHLLRAVISDDYGQTFITDAHFGRINEMLEGLKIDFQSFTVVSGKIQKV